MTFPAVKVRESMISEDHGATTMGEIQVKEEGAKVESPRSDRHSPMIPTTVLTASAETMAARA